MQEFRRWAYSGPVVIFNKSVGNWSGETIAISKKKAESNLKYQCKRDMNLVSSTKVAFFNEVQEVM